MGIDKIKKKKKKKPNQLVSKSKNGKRPGYYGSDDYGSGEDGQGGGGGGGGGGNGGDNDDNYMDYYSAPAPAPAPSYSVQDDLTDYATNVGSTASVAGDGGFEDDDNDDYIDLGADKFAPITMQDVDVITKNNRLSIGDYDDGKSLYTPAPFQGPYVDARDDPFTTAKNTNTGILSQIGSGLKTAAKIALPFVAAPIAGALGLAKPYQAYSTFNKGKKGLDYISKLSKGRVPTSADLLKNINLTQGTGPKGQPTGFDNDDGGENNIIAKNVVASNIQKYTPAQANNVKSTIDLFEDVISKGEYQGRQLDKSQIAQVASKRSELMQEYDMIMESLV